MKQSGNRLQTKRPLPTPLLWMVTPTTRCVDKTSHRYDATTRYGVRQWNIVCEATANRNVQPQSLVCDATAVYWVQQWSIATIQQRVFRATVEFVLQQWSISPVQQWNIVCNNVYRLASWGNQLAQDCLQSWPLPLCHMAIFIRHLWEAALNKSLFHYKSS